jgi:exodeoxyribonuclease-1
LYEGFFGQQDKTGMSVVRAAGKDEIGMLDIQFSDERLARLLPLYKARNYRDTLTTEDREAWEKFRFNKLMSGGAKSLAAKYFARLSELAERSGLTDQQQYLLGELQLYGESILPEQPDDSSE